MRDRLANVLLEIFTPRPLEKKTSKASPEKRGMTAGAFMIPPLVHSKGPSFADGSKRYLHQKIVRKQFSVLYCRVRTNANLRFFLPPLRTSFAVT